MIIRTVRDLRNALDGLDDEMPVRATYDGGFGGHDDGCVANVAPNQRTGVDTLWIDADDYAFYCEVRDAGQQ